MTFKNGKESSLNNKWLRVIHYESTILLRRLNRKCNSKFFQISSFPSLMSFYSESKTEWWFGLFPITISGRYITKLLHMLSYRVVNTHFDAFYFMQWKPSSSSEWTFFMGGDYNPVSYFFTETINDKLLNEKTFSSKHTDVYKMLQSSTNHTQMHNS